MEISGIGGESDVVRLRSTKYMNQEERHGRFRHECFRA
jgi:hypothetical protein